MINGGLEKGAHLTILEFLQSVLLAQWLTITGDFSSLEVILQCLQTCLAVKIGGGR